VFYSTNYHWRSRERETESSRSHSLQQVCTNWLVGWEPVKQAAGLPDSRRLGEAAGGPAASFGSDSEAAACERGLWNACRFDCVSQTRSKIIQLSVVNPPLLSLSAASQSVRLTEWVRQSDATSDAPSGRLKFSTPES
jgi:hypothetical protein